MLDNTKLQARSGAQTDTSPSSATTGQRYVHTLFEQQVLATPAAIALRFEQQQLSYAELNQRANRLAHLLLQRCGASPGIIGICLERGMDAIVALLATLKAGAAYAPVDPDYPLERQDYILQDSGVSAVISRGARLAKLPAGCVGIDIDQSMPADTGNLALNAAPDALAYLIYTSGSTGRPKGVRMPHRALLNLLDWQLVQQGVQGGGRTLQFSPLSFDVSFQEIFATLASGGTLILIKNELRLDPLALLAFLDAERVERIFLPYVALNSLASAACARDHYPASLTDVITAGEQLVITSAIRQLFSALPRCRLHNHYGPSESHVVTAHTLSSHPADWPTLPPIGRAIDQVEIALLDEARQPVAPGSAGELWIGGTQLALGYHQRPQESAERFVALDLDQGGAQIWYHSGDVARQQADGVLEILGRSDAQVKIRGYRVEPGEVEAVLMQHPAVRDAVVLVQADQTGDSKCLVAFIIAAAQVLERQSEGSVRASIRQHLQATCPDYLWPAALLLVDAFPLAASGKIDRRAFPQVDWQAIGAGDDEAPRSAQEQLLAAIWCEVLGLSAVGRNAHFFHLGGHSLHIVKVMLALRRHGIPMAIQTLYQQPVLATLAAGLPEVLSTVPPTAQQTALPDTPLAQQPAAEAPCAPQTGALSALAPGDLAQLALLTEAMPGGIGNIEAAGHLGPVQQGMLFHALAHPEGDPYVLWQVLRFEQESLLHAWIAALEASIQRHAALRISVAWQGLAQPLQVVWRKASLPVEALSGPDAMAQLQQRCRPPHNRIDLGCAPLQRCTWCHNPERGDWVLLHQMHHLALDHASVELLQHEIEARLQARPLAALPPVSIFAQPPDASTEPAQREFFDSMLADYEPLPVPPGAAPTLAGDAIVSDAWQRLPDQLSSALRSQARQHGLSVAALFHLAWAKVIAALGGRDDVVFGTVLLGRTHLPEAAQDAPGQFINTLPIRLRMGQSSLLDCLWQTQDALVRLLDHEQAPLALAQKSAALAPGQPLFASLLNYRHSAVDPMAGSTEGTSTAANTAATTAGWPATRPGAVAGISCSGIIERTTWPLAMNIDDLGQAFILNAQVEQGQDGARICAWMQTALSSIASALASAPGTRAGRLATIAPAERSLILQQWNQTASAFPDQASLHQLIQAQVEQTPDAIALEFGAQRLSYAELNQQANQLARHLVLNCGAGPDRLVGICAERSLEMVIALLAVLKAGAAYVPLDPGYPDERLAYMLRDAAPLVVLSHAAIAQPASRVLRTWQSETRATLLDLEADRAQWCNLDASALPAKPGAANHLAYVIYTSGSTGQPKGVMNAHRGVVNRLVWMQKAYPLDAADAVLQKTPFSFDVSVWEFFWPLMVGARLVLAKPEGHKDPYYLSQTIAARGITTLHFVPSMLSAFLEHGNLPAQTSLRQVFCSGEALPAASVRRFFERFGQVELHNLYGPTEAAIDVTAWNCRHGAPAGVVPIGYPIDNIRIHILDPWGEPCPLGVAGELHIAGVGVARGYWGRSALSAEKFVADPFHPEGGSMYRTGDLARYLPDGAIEYLGRNDFQVKLRGFRIELGEIENALLSHPAIKQCVVLLRQDGGEPRLVAYLTRSNAVEAAAAGASDLSDQALRQHLLQTLPAFMLPANLVWLEAFPVTANGKLDRKALPAPLAPTAIAATQNGALAIGILAEGTQTRLAQVWATLLGHHAIGPDSHFYEAGGHSLLAVALMAAISASFGVNLPLSSIVTHLGLAELASQIELALARNQSDSGHGIPAAPADSSCTRFRALPVQTAIYKAVRLDPHDLSNNSFVALGFEAEPDLKHLRNVLQMVFERHPGLRARFVLEQDELFLQPAARFMLRLEKRQSLGSLEQDLRDFVRPFTLEDGMNVQARWISDSHILLLNFSHAVIDGSGLGQLLEQLAAASLPAATLADGSNAAAYAQAFYGPEFSGLRQAHDDYWRNRLQGWQPARAHADVTPRTASWQFSIGFDQKTRIEALARRLQISLPELFMGLFLQFKARLEQQSDQLVSMIFHGRDQLIQQHLLGPLMTVLPVRADISPQSLPDLRAISQAMRAACRHYLFDAASLASTCPQLARAALFPAAFFGYFPHDGFSGNIAGLACRQLDTPAIAGAPAHWKISCEIAEHADHFAIRLEALAYTDGAGPEAAADWQALWCSLLEQILSGPGLLPGAHSAATHPIESETCHHA